MGDCLCHRRSSSRQPVTRDTRRRRTLDDLTRVSGPGSKKMRESLLEGMFGRATEGEQRFLGDLIVRNLRQGALEGVMADAVAAALGVTPDRVRRAAMLEGDLVTVASRALAEGPDALGTSTLGLFTPVQPMLAKTAATAGEAVAALGHAFVEWKLDGARIQVHRAGQDVAVFTRNLRDITASVPEVVAVGARVSGHVVHPRRRGIALWPIRPRAVPGLDEQVRGRGVRPGAAIARLLFRLSPPRWGRPHRPSAYRTSGGAWPALSPPRLSWARSSPMTRKRPTDSSTIP